MNAQVLLRCSLVVMLADKTHLLQVSDEPLAAIALEYADATLKAEIILTTPMLAYLEVQDIMRVAHASRRKFFGCFALSSVKHI